jgi:hypothetical protein
MKKLITVIALLFLATGCIDYTSNVKLNKDGSGTIEETVLISGKILEMMNSFASSFGDSTAENNKMELFDEEELKQQAAEMGKGVEYIRGEKIEEGGREGYYAVFKFDDITKVKLSESPDDKIPMDDMSEKVEETDQPEFVTFNFTKGSTSTLEIILPDPKEETEEQIEVGSDEQSEADSEMMQAQMKMFLKDFRISMNLEVEGSVEETNATYVNGNRITFLEMNFNEILENPDLMKDFQKDEPNSMSEMKEMIKNVPGFKVEMNKKVFIKFN